MLEISIFPHAFNIGGINVGLSVVIAWAVLALVILLMLCLNVFVIRRFRDKPRGMQNFLELLIDGMYNFALGKVGHCAEFMAPISMTLMVYVFFTTFVELFGLPPATEDINCTFALGLFTFCAVNVTAIKFKGVKGRIKRLCNPSPIVFPIRVVTDLIAPCSMGIRLFANVLVGGVIMQLIYMVVPIILPAVVASYFNVLHVGIQTFVFGL